MGEKPKAPKTLTGEQIAVTRPTGRRRVLGLLAASGTVLGASRPALSQATDGDSGNWTDTPDCGRGPGGARTGATDADNGRISDASGRGRGAPRC